MKKMPCLFKREFHDKSSFTILPEVTPGCEWALLGEGAVTRKWDGTACMIKDGVLYKRYDAKKDRQTGNYKLPPAGAIPCDDPDPVTGHWPHWVAVGDEPESRWHREAIRECADGTYELCGPKINGNHEGFDRHVLIRHTGEKPLGVGTNAWARTCRRFDSIKLLLEALPWEGIVFHHPDGRMCKIRRRDFGLEWPVKIVLEEQP